ncbi:hypothetical protein BDW42DRAFT_124914 [Aspergillus taichungensis]|uniref:Uncharacterized protein n=1 Tax=Aspergillus taichungensis TaxID=482145 RepID=A0A2J5HQN4_9EURO|nr:hypothetical protein BDW42DRAFT_124914 [Aspergillus taichungensis]
MEGAVWGVFRRPTVSTVHTRRTAPYQRHRESSTVTGFIPQMRLGRLGSFPARLSDLNGPSVLRPCRQAGLIRDDFMMENPTDTSRSCANTTVENAIHPIRPEGPTQEGRNWTKVRKKKRKEEERGKKRKGARVVRVVGPMVGSRSLRFL